MIKHLSLSQFILVEKADIAFNSGFNIITGETGSGKTAIIEAIALALGARADTSFVRQGEDRAIVEALFDISLLPTIPILLQDAGISYTPSEDMLIRREITREGKNRAYINCELVSLPFLQKLGKELIDYIDQQALASLRSSDYQRSLLDLFGSFETECQEFQAAFDKEKDLVRQAEVLIQLDAKRETMQEFLTFQLQEIQAADLKENEEETLFQEYGRLSDTQSCGETMREVLETLSENSDSILTKLSRLRKTADSMVKNDQCLSEASSSLHEAHLLLEEASLHYQNYMAALAHDPKRLEYLEGRLNAIARLKKKYGQTLSQILEHAEKLKAELEACEEAAERLLQVKQEQERAVKRTASQAELLTKRRALAAKELEKLLTDTLQTLNMPSAQLHIEILPQPRSQMGDDQVNFTLKANPGEKPALVREHSSGGELSRLFLAIKLVLAEKNKTPTLLFDEIDANVGGETARIIGKQLAELGKMRQILCITHFPQVAAYADCHISVEKEEAQGRTRTSIHILSKETKEKELLRMLGGVSPYLSN